MNDLSSSMSLYLSCSDLCSFHDNINKVNYKKSRFTGLISCIFPNFNGNHSTKWQADTALESISRILLKHIYKCRSYFRLSIIIPMWNALFWNVKTKHDMFQFNLIIRNVNTVKCGSLNHLLKLKKYPAICNNISHTHILILAQNQRSYSRQVKVQTWKYFW